MPTPKSIFGQIWAQKLKVIRFVWKLAHMVSQGCWFLFQYLFSEFQILIFFLGKFGPKKSKLSVLTENWYTWYIGSADSEFRLRFVKFRPQIPSLGKFRSKNQSYPFFFKIGTHGILKMLILIPTLVFWISDPRSIFGQIWAKKVKVVHFDWKLAHMVYWGCWFLFWQ